LSSLQALIKTDIPSIMPSIIGDVGSGKNKIPSFPIFSRDLHMIQASQLILSNEQRAFHSDLLLINSGCSL